MRIAQLSLENFRLFRRATLQGLSGMAVLIGANGAGKSTLLDAFAFLRDALRENVQAALARRGGFREVVSRGAQGPIRLELRLAEPAADGAWLNYAVDIGLEAGRPIVCRERLTSPAGPLLDLTAGAGLAITNEAAWVAGAPPVREAIQIESPDILALKGLGQLHRFPSVARVRRRMEGWHHTDLQIAEARPSQEAGPAAHLSTTGDNLARVAQHLYQHHRAIFDEVLARMARRIPGLRAVEAAETVDGRIVLRFQDGAFRDPFGARQVSDGTLRMFAWLVLLHDPAPHALLCVEEPENQLYPTLLEELAEEFRDYASRGGQVLLSTHSPDLLNGVSLDEIYTLRKQDGFSTIARASDSQLLTDLVAEGDRPGALWRQGLFDGIHP